MSTPRKYARAAARVRAQIADGTLKPGSPAPSGSELARATGFAHPTCRKALALLIKEGTLRPGPSPNARPRVAGPDPAGPDLAARAAALSGALAARRRAAGLTQLDLASLIGCSVTTVGHAETGRLWQSRRFWETADKTLNSGGHLLALHDAYRAATPAGPEQAPAPPDPTHKKAAMIDAIPTPLADHDPLLIQLLTLATEIMLAHPQALPADLLAMLDSYAADLTDARNGNGSHAE
jgi:hypothetical protein